MWNFEPTSECDRLTAVRVIDIDSVLHVPQFFTSFGRLVDYEQLQHHRLHADRFSFCLIDVQNQRLSGQLIPGAQADDGRFQATAITRSKMDDDPIEEECGTGQKHGGTAEEDHGDHRLLVFVAIECSKE